MKSSLSSSSEESYNFLGAFLGAGFFFTGAFLVGAFFTGAFLGAFLVAVGAFLAGAFLFRGAFFAGASLALSEESRGSFAPGGVVVLLSFMDNFSRMPAVSSTSTAEAAGGAFLVVAVFFGAARAFGAGFDTIKSSSDSPRSESQSSFFFTAFVFLAAAAFFLTTRVLFFDWAWISFLISFAISTSLSSRASSIASKSADQIASGAVASSFLTSSIFSAFCLRSSSARSNVRLQIFIPSKYSYPLANSESEADSSTESSSSSFSPSEFDFFSSFGIRSYPRSFKSASNSVRFLLLTTRSPSHTSSTKRALFDNIMSSLAIFSKSMALRFT
mmetsp:Transcript_39990/g.86233  ORF Transcript_39990/g.86233 Transcript_39990/m.86233 type:complete len:330 (-) Transcript_39990:2634-3623(-)